MFLLGVTCVLPLPASFCGFTTVLICIAGGSAAHRTAGDTTMICLLCFVYILQLILLFRMLYKRSATAPLAGDIARRPMEQQRA